MQLASPPRLTSSRPLLVGLCSIALLGACGARSALDPSLGRGATGGGGGGGASADAAVDGSPWDASRLDAAVPRDLRPPLPDSCLPAPANLINGAYHGGWKGTVDCPPLLTNTAAAGELTISIGIVPGQPETFDVRGRMSGDVAPGFGFSAEVDGAMSCTNIEATISRFDMGQGGLVIQIDGRLDGSLSIGPNSVPAVEGRWRLAAHLGNCTASGQWFAARQ